MTETSTAEVGANSLTKAEMKIKSASDRDRLGDNDCQVGYGRPPHDTRFRPGQSGNPKGRPKVNRTIWAETRRIFMDRVSVRNRNKVRRVPRFVALVEAMMIDAVKGDHRSRLVILNLAREFNLFEEIALSKSNDLNLTRENMRALSDAALAELIAIERAKANGQQSVGHCK